MWRTTNQQPSKMRSNLHNIFNRKQFFDIVKASNDRIEYMPKEASQILIKNIHLNWLRYVHLKTHKIMPVYIQKNIEDIQKIDKNIPIGVINQNNVEFEGKVLKYDFENPPKKNDLEFKLIIPKENSMQYFIQWQRYRKYWWSSITTTPSLFSIGDIKQTDHNAQVDIIAQLQSGPQPVECITMKNKDDTFKGAARLSCTMSLEQALIVIIMDGLNQDKYLRLHRKIAPYKMSFGLNFTDPNKKDTLMELAKVLFILLKIERISACLPDFSTSLEDQIKENLSLGIPYTAILNETTLNDGIFHLYNSSTTLKEQIHVADFQSYASLIFGDKKC